jgi:hypothetical protein
MKILKNYKIIDESICLYEKENLESYPYLLIFDISNIEYIICKYEIIEKENFLIIDIERDYDYLTDEILGHDIEIIGFLESVPYNYEHEESIIQKYEAEKTIKERFNEI